MIPEFVVIIVMFFSFLSIMVTSIAFLHKELPAYLPAILFAIFVVLSMWMYKSKSEPLVVKSTTEYEIHQVQSEQGTRQVSFVDNDVINIDGMFLIHLEDVSSCKLKKTVYENSYYGINVYPCDTYEIAKTTD